jgi:hypothetical protein
MSLQYEQTEPDLNTIRTDTAKPVQWFDVTKYGLDLSKTDTHVEGIRAAINKAKSEGGGCV